MKFDSLDHFSKIQDDILDRGRSLGGALTLCVYAIVILGTLCEVFGFLFSSSYATNMMLDNNNDKLLQLNVDVTMHKIECKNLRLLVKDSFGDEPMTMFNDFVYRPVNADGSQAGKSYQELDTAELEEKARKHFTEGEQKELDSSWDSSHDGFKHQSFKQVIEAHDFVFVNFFASWCSHCQNFAPAWAALAPDLAKKQYTDGDGKKRTVLFIKVNCVDFPDTCNSEEIDAYPTLRLYQRDTKWSEYEGSRDKENIDAFTEKQVLTAHIAFPSGKIKTGCQISGRILVPRVPGLFKIEAGGTTADQRLDPAKANVSHTIAHLSFSDPDEEYRRSWRGLPKWILDFTNPLENKEFMTTALERAPHHYVKVVSTQTGKENVHVYQMSATSREATVKQGEVPEMRIMYDLEPMMIVLTLERKPWYDFLCGLIGIVGGIYVSVDALASVSLHMATAFEASRGRATRSASGGLLQN